MQYVTNRVSGIPPVYTPRAWLPALRTVGSTQASWASVNYPGSVFSAVQNCLQWSVRRTSRSCTVQCAGCVEHGTQWCSSRLTEQHCAIESLQDPHPFIIGQRTACRQKGSLHLQLSGCHRYRYEYAGSWETATTPPKIRWLILIRGTESRPELTANLA